MTITSVSNNKWILTCDNNSSHTLHIFFSIAGNVDSVLYGNNIFVNSKSYNNLELDESIEGDKIFRHLSIPTNDKQIFEIYVNKTCAKEFILEIYIDDAISESENLLYKPKTIDIHDGRSTTKFNMPDVSYSLLRVNPKLTGNIKLVVDSNNDLYLDTFKVSTALSDKKYRKLPINSDTYYGQSVCVKFKDVPISDFYKIEDKCYELYTTAQKFSEQYYDIYNSGVRTNSDKLYSENFSLLSPLCIKNVLPDFFLIFKVSNDVNIKCTSDKEKIEYFIQNGILVKSYDLREHSKIGKYLRTIQSNAKQFSGDGYISSDLTNHNKFIGISLDKGVVTSIYESTYAESNFASQVEMNDFYTNAFERNHLISKDIINLEFMFNDFDSSMFNINTYYGIYVKVNTEESDFNYLSDNSFSKKIHTFPGNTSIAEIYPNIIYGLTTEDNFIRLAQGLYGEKSKEILNEYKLKPYKNVLTANVNKSELSKLDYKSYLTFSLLNTLEVGEHLRIISPKNKRIYEIIVSNNEEYNYFNDSNISEITHNYVYLNLIKYDVYKICICSKYRKNISNIEESIKTQIKNIYTAYNQFNSDLFYAAKYNDNSLSIIGVDNDLIFERLCAESGFTEAQDEYINTTTSEDNVIKFFGNIAVPKCKLDISDRVIEPWENKKYSYFYPYNTELTGNRIAYIIDFYNISNDVYTTIINKNSLLDDIIVYNQISLDENDTSYVLYDNFIVTSYDLEKKNEHIKIEARYLQSGFSLDANIINVYNPVVYNNTISFYNVYPINAGICSILNIKDFAYEVLDSSALSYSICDNVGDSGEFTHKDFFNTKLSLRKEENVKNYFAKISDIDSAIDENDFYKNLFNKKTSNISLISPYCCKWKYLGTDARCNNLRVMYDFAYITKINNACSYYAVEGKSYKLYDSSIGYVYNKDNIDNIYKKYINNSINDSCKSSNDINDIFKNKLLSNKDISISDLLYNDFAPNFSPIYVIGNEIIEFISGGVKIQMRTNNTNIIDPNKYQGYNGVLITLYDSNISNEKINEVIIDEIHREILVIYYVNALKTSTGVYISYNHSLDNIKYINANTLEIPYINNIHFNDNESKQIVITSYSNNDNFTKDYNVCLMGDAENNEGENSIIIKNPVLYVEGIKTNINGYTFYQYHTGITNNIYLFGNIDVTDEGMGHINDFDTNISILIKGNNDSKDYSSLGTLNISIIPAFKKEDYYAYNKKFNKGYIHSGYIEPIKNDILVFKNNSDKINELSLLFKQNFKESNILIDNVNCIPQMWFKKYTDISGYCSNNKPNRLGIDLKHDYSVMHDSLLDLIYNRYFDSSTYVAEDVYGYESGYNINTFINSKAVVLKDKNDKVLEITVWKDTEIIDNKCIKLNVSDSIIYHILHSNAFMQSWEYLQISDDTYKINYIKNTILSLININNKNTFELYKLKEFASTLSFNIVMNDTYEFVTNVKNELKYENGKYFMYVYPDDITTYSAKMKISM